MSIASRFAANTCHSHGKKSYVSKDLAKKAIEELHEPGMRAYRCDATTGEELWHIGHLPKAVINGTKTTAEHYEGVTFVDGSELRYGTDAPLTRSPSPLDIRPRNGHKPAAEDSVEALLAAAEASQVPVAQKLAAQIRDLVSALAKEMAASVKERTLREEIASLRAQLDGKLQEYKDLRGVMPHTQRKPDAKPAVQSNVRAWARARGIEVNDRGAIPAAVRKAYEDAMAGVSR